MRHLGRGLLGLLLGFIAGAFIAFVLAYLAAIIFNISQREGAYAMGVVFGIMPAGGVLGAIIGIIWAILRGIKRDALSQPPQR